MNTLEAQLGRITDSKTADFIRNGRDYKHDFFLTNKRRKEIVDGIKAGAIASESLEFGKRLLVPEANVFDLNVIAKSAPTVFIRREGVDFRLMNRHVRRALGEYSNVGYRAKT